MRGSKYEWGGAGSGKWRLRVYVGLDAQKKPVQVSRNFIGGARAAENALRKLVEETGKTTVERDAKLSTLFEAWLGHIAPRRTPQTIQGYQSKVRSRLDPALGKIRLDQLKVQDLDRQYARWEKEGLAPATIRQLHVLISGALEQAVKWGWRQDNPAKRATPPTLHHRPMGAMTPADLRVLVDQAERFDPAVAAAIALAALTGARRGELCSLRWSDVNMDSATLTISDAVSELVGGGWRVGDTKTHQSRRLALDTVALGVLRARRAAQENLAAMVGVRLVADPWVLSRHANGGEPMRPDWLSHAFIQVRDRVGMKWRFHDLRHWAATVAISSGVDVRTVAGRLGHANPATTLRVYAGFVEATDQVAAGVLGAAFTGPLELEAGDS